MEGFPSEVWSALMLLVSFFGFLALLVVFVLISSQIWSILVRRGFWSRVPRSLRLGIFFERHQKIFNVLGKGLKVIKDLLVGLLVFFGRISDWLLILFAALVFGVIPWMITYQMMNPKGKGIEVFWAYVVAALIISLPLGVIFLIRAYIEDKRACSLNPKKTVVVSIIVLWVCLTWLPAFLISVPWFVIRLLFGGF